jgi:hypothetical protein
VPHIEAYIARLLSKEVCNPAALEGQQRMKKGTTWAAKCARTKVSVVIVTADQLDRKLASVQPSSPPPDLAMSVAWHHDNGLAVPDHLTVEHGLTVQDAGHTSTGPLVSAGSVHRRPHGGRQRT